MAKHIKKSFSHELPNDHCTDARIEAVSHPLLRQILNDVLSEKADDGRQGSAFGEGGFAG